MINITWHHRNEAETELAASGDWIGPNLIAQTKLPTNSDEPIYRQLVRIDFSAVNRIDSEGIGQLLTLNRRFRDKQGRLVLHSPAPQVAEVLELLRLNEVLEITTAPLATAI